MIWSSDLSARPGKQVGSSAWRTISQDRIDRFAAATDDFQFVHTDRERAARETPFGGTIAHGFLTLSMLSTLAEEVMPVSPDLKAAMLVGIDRVKFLSPVKSGARIRGVFTLDRATRLARGKILMKLQCVIEIENQPKAAMSCEISWMFLLDDVSPRANTAELASQLGYH